MAKKEKEPKTNNKQKRHFFKDMKAELKKVIWPTPKQTANNTVAVIAFTVAIAVIVFVLDVCFDAINKNGVVALQEKVKSSYSASNTTEENTTSEDEETTTEESENATNVEAEATTEDSSNTENSDNTESQE